MWEDECLREMSYFLGVCFMLLLSYPVGASIGCEYYNSTVLLCYNEGLQENLTFFEVPTGQMWNFNDSRQNWMTYEAGAFLDLSNKWDVDFSLADFSYYNDSDYYKVVWSYERTQGPRRAVINHTRMQHLKDNRVTIWTNITLTKNWDNWNHPIHIYWGMTDIDIWNDGLIDGYNLDNGSIIAWPLNASGTYTARDYLTINSITPSEGAVKWWWQGNKTVIIENEEAYFYDTIQPPFIDGQLISLRYEWIDVDPCTPVCSIGCQGFLNVNDSYSVYDGWNQTDTFEVKATLSIAGFTCGPTGSCSWPNCAVGFFENYSDTGLSTKYEAVINEDYNQSWNCINDECYTKIPPTGRIYYRNATIEGIRPGRTRVVAMLTSISNISQTLAGAVKYAVVGQLGINYSLDLNITLNAPYDGIILNFNNMTDYSFIANTSDNTSDQKQRYSWSSWLAIYVNNSLYANSSSDRYTRSTWYTNTTAIIDNLTASGIYEWDAYACDPYRKCAWSWNGNRTIIFNYTILPLFVKRPFLYQLIGNNLLTKRC